MDRKICGPCAIKRFSLSERIEISKSRVLDVVYVCPHCGVKHSWSYSRRDLPLRRPFLLDDSSTPMVLVQANLF